MGARARGRAPAPPLLLAAAALAACALGAACQGVRGPAPSDPGARCTPLFQGHRLAELERESGSRRLVAVDDWPREDFVKRYGDEADGPEGGEDGALPAPRRAAWGTVRSPPPPSPPPPPPFVYSAADHLSPARYPVQVFDYSFRDTYIPYPIYPIRLDPLRRPLAKIGTLPVASGIARVNGGGFSFDMKVWWPVDGPEGCMPAVVILHPVQVFSAEAGESEYQQTCEHLASLNVICFISLEVTGQFGSGTTRVEQTGLADRAMEMWNHLRRQSTVPSSPLYGRVCNRLGVTGYSMGSGSAALVASLYGQPRWGVRALGYIHGTLVGGDKLRQIDVPTMIGGGTADALVNADGQFRNFDSATNRNPLIAVLLKGAPHVTGPCGNTCPVIQSCCRGTYFYDGHMQIVTGQFSAHTKWLIPFFLAYLKDDLEASRAVWNTDQIELDDRVDHVLRNTRVVADLPTVPVTAKSGDPEGAGPAAGGEAQELKPDDSVIAVLSGERSEPRAILQASAFTNATGVPYSLVLDSVRQVAILAAGESDAGLCRDLLSVVPAPAPREEPRNRAAVNSIEDRFVALREGLAADEGFEVHVGRTAAPPAPGGAPEEEDEEPRFRRTWWGEVVEVEAAPQVYYYEWSAPETFYAAVSASCLPEQVASVTCALGFRVVNGNDGATMSDAVTRLVRVHK